MKALSKRVSDYDLFLILTPEGENIFSEKCMLQDLINTEGTLVLKPIHGSPGPAVAFTIDLNPGK